MAYRDRLVDLGLSFSYLLRSRVRLCFALRFSLPSASLELAPTIPVCVSSFAFASSFALTHFLNCITLRLRFDFFFFTPSFVLDSLFYRFLSLFWLS
jgi:hypothetical protein